MRLEVRMCVFRMPTRYELRVLNFLYGRALRGRRNIERIAQATTNYLAGVIVSQEIILVL